MLFASTECMQQTSVLISTYWNVNNGLSNYLATTNSFNLNLLECKSQQMIESERKLASFNLNLLECKFFSCSLLENTLKVLISTYWNVNF